jgi:hypothetical protein
MAASTLHCINYQNNKPSYITVYDASAPPYTGSTKVLTVYDAANELSWNSTIIGLSSTTLKIRLKGKGKHSHALVAKAKAKADPKLVGDPDDPVSGTLTITLTNPTQTITATPVKYVDDNPP